MNKLLKLMKNRRSIRSYSDEELSNNELDAIIEAALSSPTSINGQQYSIIVITDKTIKSEIAKLTGSQKWINESPAFLLFVSDYNKVYKTLSNSGKEFKHIENVEALLVGAVDCAISMTSAMNMATYLGLGTVPIGAIRSKSRQIIELLNLPKYVYPIVGLCVGHINELPKLKPKFKKEAMIHNNKYDDSKTLDNILEYDSVIKEYMDRRMGEKLSWTDRISRFYVDGYAIDESDVIKEQGYQIK